VKSQAKHFFVASAALLTASCGRVDQTTEGATPQTGAPTSTSEGSARTEPSSTILSPGVNETSAIVDPKADLEIAGREGAFQANLFVMYTGDVILACPALGDAAFASCSGPTFVLNEDPKELLNALSSVAVKTRPAFDAVPDSWASLEQLAMSLSGPFEVLPRQGIGVSAAAIVGTATEGREPSILEGSGTMKSGGPDDPKIVERLIELGSAISPSGSVTIVDNGTYWLAYSAFPLSREAQKRLVEALGGPIHLQSVAN
jgi:hypothetical protein